jgi:broad specificity phosphatase PhoE
MATSIYLLRHGETEWSLSGRHTSRTDLPLTADGERRASQLRERLKGIAFTDVLTSPLQRAQRTCELAGYGAVAQVDPDLHEWDYGTYEGKTTAEIRAQHTEWLLFQEGCPQGESVGQISQRADRVLASLRPMDGTVALFSHGHFLRALAVRWIGRPVGDGRHFALDTGSVSILGYEHRIEDVPVIVRWNTTSDTG